MSGWGGLPAIESPTPLGDGRCPECDEDLSVHSAGLGCWLCDCTYGRRTAADTIAPE